MTYESEFDEFLNETISVRSRVSGTGTGYGASNYGSPRTVQVRIEQGAKRIQDSTGREVVSMTRVFAKPTATDGAAFFPVLTDEITLPAGYLPQAPPIIRVDRQNDAQGLHHLEISL